MYEWATCADNIIVNNVTIIKILYILFNILAAITLVVFGIVIGLQKLFTVVLIFKRDDLVNMMGGFRRFI